MGETTVLCICVRLLGTGTISLREVVRSQSGQAEMSLSLLDGNKRKIEARSTLFLPILTNGQLPMFFSK